MLFSDASSKSGKFSAKASAIPEKFVYDSSRSGALSKISCNFALRRVRRCPLDDKVARVKAEDRAARLADSADRGW